MIVPTLGRASCPGMLTARHAPAEGCLLVQGRSSGLHCDVEAQAAGRVELPTTDRGGRRVSAGPGCRGVVLAPLSHPRRGRDW